MVSAPQHSQHLQQAQDAGANVEDVFQGLSFQFLGGPMLCNPCSLAGLATALSARGDKSVFRGELVTVNAVRHVLSVQSSGKAAPSGQRNTRENVGHAHARFDALKDGVSLASGMFRYVDQAMSLAINLNESRPALVSLLLRARGPFAVAGAVAKVVVNPVQGMRLRRLGPHVFDKLVERAPFGANRDPASAVVVIMDKVRVVAAGTHGAPSDVKRVICSVFH